MKKFLKLSLILASTLFVLFIVALILIFMALPNPTQIKSFLSPDKNKKEITAKSDMEATKAKTQIESSKELDQMSKPEGSNLNDNNGNANLAFEKLVDSKTPLSTACQTLSNVDRKQNIKLSPEEFGKRFQESLLNKSVDPMMESVKPIIKHVLNQPMFLKFISKVKETKSEEQNALIAKAEFYQLLYDTYQEMNENKENMHFILDQSYLTLMLGKAIELRPELAHNSQVISYCEDIEKVLNDGTKVDFDQEKLAFLNFLTENNIDPKMIGFDINYKSEIKINFDKNGLQFNGGWLDQILTVQTKNTENKSLNQ